MVTSNKLPEKKIVKMAEQNNIVVVPQRTLLGEVNEHITCPLCRGYYIDATTIVECLHSFCRSCIIKHLQVKSYCPVCEMMINSAKPNIKLDKALQDIVYKLVPGLFQKEMERRQLFYASRPGPAASATPEQRGEDTERIIFSPEDVISFSLEYCDVTDTDSVSSKSSDSNEAQATVATARRYLQCPAVVNISHLKKFLSMKFDIDSAQFAIDILYKRVPLPDYYTLMDIAYIYNWKRNEPMRFFYQIIDYVAIRSRIFDINRKGTNFGDRKSSPSSAEDTNVNSPAPNLNDHGSEASSGIDSPMPGENSSKQLNDSDKKKEKSDNPNNKPDLHTKTTSPKNEDVEKSQFLNSFELTAKSNSASTKSSPDKSENVSGTSEANQIKIKTSSTKGDESLKRKLQQLPQIIEMKKIKIEIEKTKLPCNTSIGSALSSAFTPKGAEISGKSMEHENLSKNEQQALSKTTNTSIAISSSTTDQSTSAKQNSDSLGPKRPVSGPQNISSPKRKPLDSNLIQALSAPPKTISPLKLQLPKLDSKTHKHSDVPKPLMKKIPDLKPSNALSQSAQNKGQTINKVRMDLLANNSDPTIDRSKILSQVKSSLIPNTGQSSSGDPLKSLFDSCKINIPSSLSITLTDQKQDLRNPNESTNEETKNVAVNKNLATASSVPSHKVPSPPVHNYIEILKLPETDQKKPNKADVLSSSEIKSNTPNKGDPVTSQQKPKSSETPSAKGPIPNLKPIADTKLTKQSCNFVGPKTFQQTFEQQLHTLQTDKKPKLPKNKSQVPKLVPATPKAFSAANLNNNPGNKPMQSSVSSTIETKPGTALDLSTPHNLQSQLNPQQTKAFETMQSIANLAKKQSMPSKGTSQTSSQSFSNVTNRPINPPVGPLRIPSTNAPQTKKDNVIPGALPTNNLRQEPVNKAHHNKTVPSASPLSSSTYIPSHHSPNRTQPSPRPQTRSPSSSPKLVIAEEKQISNPNEQNANQSNQITSTQLPSLNMPKNEPPKASPGPSKPGLKPMKPLTPSGKITGIRQAMSPVVKPNPTPADIQLMAHQALLRHQIEMNAWLKAQRFDVYKNMSNISHQSQNDYKKDK